MEQELRLKIAPIVDTFVQGLLKIEEEIKTKLLDLSGETAKVKQEQGSLKIQKAENEHQLNLAKDKLADERVRQNELSNQLKTELARYSKLSKEYEQKIQDIEQNLKDSVVEKELVSEALSRAKKETESYKLKTEKLAEDLARFNKLETELKEKEKYLSSKEKALQKKEEEQVVKGNQLNDIELKLKAREAEVERLIKRYELERFIKGEK